MPTMGWLRCERAGGPEERRAAEGEDPAVGGDLPVPAARGGGDPDHGLVQGDAAGRAGDGGVAERVHVVGRPLLHLGQVGREQERPPGSSAAAEAANALVQAVRRARSAAASWSASNGREGAEQAAEAPVRSRAAPTARRGARRSTASGSRRGRCPSASRTIVLVSPAAIVIGVAVGGGVPSCTQRSMRLTAADTHVVRRQPVDLVAARRDGDDARRRVPTAARRPRWRVTGRPGRSGPSRRAPTGGSVAESAWRAGKCPSASVSVSSTSTGTSRSVRICATAGAGTAGTGSWASGAPLPLRL